MISLRRPLTQNARTMNDQPGTREFDEILFDTQARVRAYVAGIGISPNDVDDIAQETYLELYRHWDKIPPGMPPERWVKGIAKNKCLNHLRKTARRGRLHRHALADLLANTTTQLERLSAQEAWGPTLEDCLSKLPPERREMLQWRYGQNQSPSAIAQLTHSTAEAVRRTLHRLRAGLRDCVAQKLARNP